MAAVKPNDAMAQPKQRGLISGWLLTHAATAMQALHRLLSQPFASFMTILVIGITLALPASMHILIKNASIVSADWNNALDFSVYLKSEISEQDARRLRDIIEQRADIESVVLITADAALEEFQDTAGFGEALSQLNENPLPHTLLVRPSASNTQVTLGLLNEELGNLPETEFVQMDTEWVQRFHTILDIIRKAISIGSILLAFAVLIIIGNTIRLDIQNRREEIEVCKLIGASNGFVRRPFLYSGLWYGLGGGLLALAIIIYGLYALSDPIARLSGLYTSDFRLSGLDIRETLILVGAGIGLGLIGSWTAASRHMRRIEPGQAG